MGWRIVSVAGIAKLDYRMDYLVVRKQDGIQRIHLSEISVLLLESTAVSMTAYLLCELNRHKIDVIFCDEKRCPYGMLASLYGSHDTSLKYRRQTEWSQETKDLIWSEIIRTKIRGQAVNLPQQQTAQKAALLAFAAEVLPGDPTNREGHAAKVYFNALFGMPFSRSQEDPINSALDYGYSILLSLLAREITANGYCTQLGIFHDNMFNSLNLASDLMEPFRPYIDAAVYALKPEKLEHDEKVEIIKTLNRTTVIDGKEQYLINAVRIYTRSVFDALEERDISKLKFPCYELPVYANDRLL